MYTATVPLGGGGFVDRDEGSAALDVVGRFAAATDSECSLPCRINDPDLWFSDNPAELEQAKAICVDCPLKAECLAGALDRQEPWGVWGGEIFERGSVITRKRPRGRPRKQNKTPGVAA
jgi:WhiB family transcriptional regulator, redox-sensing transcriptional regulator